MCKADFWQYIEAHSDIQILALNNDALLLRNALTGRFYRVAYATLMDIDARELHEILSGVREPNALTTITRIVGYYSKTMNWNRSKLGELEDRRRGDYVFEPERPVERRQPVTAVRAAG